MRYHATTASAHAALTEGCAAFARRRRAKRHWPEIEALTHDLLHFRRRLTVTRDDARDGGLSLLAITSFCCPRMLHHAYKWATSFVGIFPVSALFTERNLIPVPP